MSEAPSFNPLHAKYPELHKSPEVSQAAVRQEKQTGLRPHQPSEKLNTWMDTLEKIHIDRDEQTAERIKEVYHKEYVMRPDQVPEAYFDLQRRIAREQGHGDVHIPDQVRREMAETVSRDQERSLDAWVDYLSSKDAPYPMWFKYYTFRNVVKLADFDKEKSEFKKRSTSTTASFPDINAEALSYVADVMTRHYNLAKSATELPEIEPTTKALLDRDASFAKLYAHAIEKIRPASQEELAVTDGRWVKYDQGSDGTILAKTLQGHGTGWCTAGEGTAQAQLDAGDFYVYYTKDLKGVDAVPRVAIRMQDGQIAEVRGIQADQNLEASLVDIAKHKMSELPGARAYEKKVSDMQALTKIEKKLATKQELTTEELRFLYEIDQKVEGFGYQRDPRIEQIKSQRDPKADLAKIFGAASDQIAEYQSDLTSESVALIGHLELARFPRGLYDLPKLEYLSGGINLEGATNLDQTTALRLIEAGKGEYVAHFLDRFRGLTSDTANRLIDVGQGRDVADYLDQFQGLDHQEIANRLFDAGKGEYVASYLDHFQGLDHQEIADRLIEDNQGYNVSVYLNRFQGLSVDTANWLIDSRHGYAVANYLDRFRGLDHQEIANRIIDVGQGGDVARYLGNFQGIDHQEIANRLIEAKQANDVVKYLNHFQGLTSEIADRLIDSGQGFAVSRTLESFQGLTSEIADRLIDSGYGYGVAFNLDRFSGLNHHEVARRIIDAKQNFDGLIRQELRRRGLIT